MLALKVRCTMALEKLLHVANSTEVNTKEIERFAALRELGLEEVILFKLPNGDNWKAQLGDLGIQVKTITMEGSRISSVLETARREGVSFISTHIDEESKRVLRRPLAKELLKSSLVPVMLIPKVLEIQGVRQNRMFDNVVFATDWSESCKKAMRYLLDFRKVIKALEIVNVVEKRLSVREMRELRYKLSAWRSAFLDHGIDAESHIYAGNRQEEILSAAKDYRATCIVMGSSHKPTLKRIFRRSCVYGVAEGSVVPTIVVP